MKHVKIEMIHDIVCSWCPIGYNNLKRALAQLEDSVSAEIYFLPYELNPGMGKEGEEINQQLMRKTGWSPAQAAEYRKNLIETGKQAGVYYDFSKRTHYWNTSKAHKLIHWAESQAKQVAMNEALIPAYFTNGMDVYDDTQLLNLVAEIGLDRAEAKEALASEMLDQQIRDKHQRVRQFNIRSVPSFIFNETQFVTGSNSPEFFVDYLNQLVVPQQKAG